MYKNKKGMKRLLSVTLAACMLTTMLPVAMAQAPEEGYTRDSLLSELPEGSNSIPDPVVPDADLPEIDLPDSSLPEESSSQVEESSSQVNDVQTNETAPDDSLSAEANVQTYGAVRATTPTAAAQALADALNNQVSGSAVADGDTVTLQKNISGSNSVSVNGGVTLNLNGKTITSSTSLPALKFTHATETFVIEDKGTPGASGKITASGWGQPAVAITSTGTVDITGGTIEATGTDASAILNVDGGKVLINEEDSNFPTRVTAGSNAGKAIELGSGTQNEVVLSVTGGTIESAASPAISNVGYGTVDISGGAISGSSSFATIVNTRTGLLNISGGTVKSEGAQSCAITSAAGGRIVISETDSNVPTKIVAGQGGKSAIQLEGGAQDEIALSVTGGTIEGYSAATICNLGLGMVNISGGTVSGLGSFPTIDNTENAALNISGGTVVQADAGVVIMNRKTGKITISEQPGGTPTLVISDSSNGGTAAIIELMGGTQDVEILSITGGTVKSSNDRKIITNFGAGTVSISGGLMSSEGIGIYNLKKGALNISGGTVQAKYNVIGNFEDGIITISEADENIPTSIVCTGQSRVIDLTGGTAGQTVLSMTGGAVSTVNGEKSIRNKGAGTVNISGGTVKAGSGIAIDNEGTGVVAISQADAAVKTLVTAATATGNSGTVVMRNGTLAVAGGIIENTGTRSAVFGTGVIDVSISGGTIKAATGTAVSAYAPNGFITATVTGGNIQGIAKTGAAVKDGAGRPAYLATMTEPTGNLDKIFEITKLGGQPYAYALDTSVSVGNKWYVWLPVDVAEATYDNVLYKTTVNTTGTAEFKPVSEPEPEKEINVTGVTAPTANAGPDVTADNGANYTAGPVQWNYYDAAFHGSYFGYDTSYTALVLLTPNTGYTFPAGAKVKMNGAQAVSVLNNDGTMLVSYTFPNTAKRSGSNDVSQYTDLVVNEWYYETITEGVSRSLFQGVAPTRFAPNEGMTRAMYYVVVGRLDGQTLGEKGGDNWYADALEWAVKMGVSDGNTPMQNVTREQAVTMLYRYDSGNDKVNLSVLNDFNDVEEVSPWAQEAMAWAIQEGILLGDNHGNLNPKADATRAEAATIFSRYQGR